VDPRIPIWKLARAETAILAGAGSRVVTETWTVEKCREIMRRCKLYDYESHHWLDFEGRPTGPAARADASSGRPSNGRRQAGTEMIGEVRHV